MMARFCPVALIAAILLFISFNTAAAVKVEGGLAWPIIDGWVIPDDQYKLYSAGKYNDTPILVAYNSDEGLSFSPPDTPAD